MSYVICGEVSSIDRSASEPTGRDRLVPPTHLPPQLRRLWRIPEPETRHGRPSLLDTERVVEAAIVLADRGGVEAATLPKVAVELGVTAMSLYRHVGSKLELLELMVDRASTPPRAENDERPRTADAWRAAIQTWADRLWDLYCERPWIVRVPVHGPPAGPNQLAWLEQALGAFVGTDFTWREKLGFCMVVNGHVRQSVLLTQELAAGRTTEKQAEIEHRYGRTMADLVDADRFPELTSMFTAEVFDGADEPSMSTARRDFHAGLTLILDGIDRQQRTRAADPG